MLAADLDFFLPPELIAQAPLPNRSASKLLHYDRRLKTIVHRIFSDLPALLRPGDLLVFNNARVIPARFTLRKNTGGRVEGLFLRELDSTDASLASSTARWRVLLRDVSGAKDLYFADDPAIRLTVLQPMGEGEFEVEVSGVKSTDALLARVGRMPLPPYIKRDKDHDARDEQDRKDYQTVYAHAPGSVAAPTAGLHFTEAVLKELESCGIRSAAVTLHVGLGTFKPVTVEKLDAHPMHTEGYEIDAAAADALNLAQAENRRIVAVGTTAARVLESYPDRSWEPTVGETSIFIYPPYRWKRVGALLTNFHLPRSTLIALVAALVGLDEQRRLYQTAIENRYRFFSFGDAMLIE